MDVQPISMRVTVLGNYQVTFSQWWVVADGTLAKLASAIHKVAKLPWA